MFEQLASLSTVWSAQPAYHYHCHTLMTRQHCSRELCYHYFQTYDLNDRPDTGKDCHVRENSYMG